MTNYNDLAIYKEKYNTYVQEVADGAFNATTIQALYSKYSVLVEPYATTEVNGYTFLNNSSDFQAAINELNSHVVSRANAVSNYLGN